MDVCGRIKGLSSLVKKLIMDHKAKGAGNPYRLLGAAAVVRSSKQRAPRRGHMLVHVGEEEGRRYEVPLKYLSFPAMVALMKRQGEEHLEEKIDGPLRVYCCTQVFDELLSRLGEVREKDHP